jgi:hypothetical protein
VNIIPTTINPAPPSPKTTHQVVEDEVWLVEAEFEDTNTAAIEVELLTELELVALEDAGPPGENTPTYLAPCTPS